MSVFVAGGTMEGVEAHQRAMNASRYVPTMPEIFRKVSDDNRICIYNVGPWSHKRELGSAGIYFIPACPEGQDHSEPLVLNGVEEEPYPINEVECAMKPKAGVAGQLTGSADGMLLAQQILGFGPHVAPASSLIPFGVFATKNIEWDKKARVFVLLDADALTAARLALRNKLTELVRLASEAYAKGPNAFAEVAEPDYHFRAARMLSKTVAECPWLANTQAPGQRANCPGCGSIHDVGVMKCRGCGYILDKPRYDAAVKAGMFAG